MFIIPVPISKAHKTTLTHTKELVKYQNGYVAINRRCIVLITSLNTPAEKDDGTLIKETTSHDDLYDSFRLGLQFWH